MSSFRPITDVWSPESENVPIVDVGILARAKYADGKKRYGGYLGGFPERARILLGASATTPVLHVCGGKARQYPYPRGFGLFDRTLDLDPEVSPDYQQDARDPWPMMPDGSPWQAILCDPPYSPRDAENWLPGKDAYPTPRELLTRAVEALAPGGRVGIIHYLWSRPVAGLSDELALIAVGSGRDNRARWFVVFERTRP
jgi:hypothetical protein